MFWAKWKFRNKEMENIKGVNLLGKCTYNSKYEKSFNRIDHIFSFYPNQMAPP